MLEENVSTHIDPTSLDFNIGYSCFALGLYERSVENYEHLLALDPNYTWAYDNRGIAYVFLKDYERAIQDLNKAIELDPKDAHAYRNRGGKF